MAEAYILEAVRSAIGKRNGALADTRPDDLAAMVLRGLVDRAGVDPAEVEDVVMGCVTQIGEQGFNIGRTAPLIAGFPVSVTGTTVNRMCGSSLQAVNFAAQAVMAGQADLVVGAGVESMTRVAMGSDGAPLSDQLAERFDIVPQGISAELICERWGLGRAELDAFSLASHERAVTAAEAGDFHDEILPLRVTKAGDLITFDTDEGPRADTTLERLARLKPAFKSDGMVTAASSSQISDGSAAVLIGSAEKALALGLRRRARIRATALAGVDPTIMLTGVIPATHKALARAGLRIGDVDLFEVNEAFAPVVLAWARETGASLEKTNVNGGAVALGHPLGASGARLLTTLLHAMERRDATIGLATLCIGFGMAVATVIERV
ncbi:MAG: acetyl-CoA acetyltransferase [Myxococcales bacterium]